MTKLNSSKIEQLGKIFYSVPKIVSNTIDGNQFITITFDEEKVSKGFGMITFAGRHIIPMMKLIEDTHFVNSITTSVYKTTLRTQILIVENSAREDIEN